MKAIISPYEKTILDNKTIAMPCVVIDTKADAFDSSDIPDGIIDASNAERLIFLDEAAHAQAVNLGYTEVDV